jgi:hypothetical protein
MIFNLLPWFFVILTNVFDHYLRHDHYLISLKILFFIFSSRRRQRRRQQYEIFQKIFYETSFNIVNICQILLTDERMNCYCCLSKMNEKFSLLYRKSSSFIYLLIFIFWFIEIYLRIEIFVCHEDFFFWSSYLRLSLSLRFDLIKIAYSSSNLLTSRRFRKSINLKKIISIEWL